ncbi:GNAT family N-acetyltransferase, partial [bacterium]|nr:GNAT family N-acetyltransferase [bacterium]
LRNHKYEIVNGGDFSNEDLMRSVDLYNMLYLEKYSYFNPQFTFEFMKLARDEKALHMLALKRDGRMDGVMG